MMLLAQTSILPGWLVLPVACLTMLVVSGHVLATHASAEMPLRRRRLRVANGMLMLLVTSLLAYALGIAGVVESPTAQPDQTRQFVLIWLTIIGLLGVVVALACADAMVTGMQAWAMRRVARREMRHALARDLSEQRVTPQGSPRVRG